MRRGALIALTVLCFYPLFAQQALSNDAVIKMVKMGFSDDVIATAIGRSPGTFDTSLDGLIVLKNAGVGNKAISAMVSKPSPSTETPQTSPVFPAKEGVQSSAPPVSPPVYVPQKSAPEQQSKPPHKMHVKVIDRQDKEGEYNYAAVYNNVATGATFKVYGATFTLQLPDGRLAIVNCDSKFAEHFAGQAGNRRSCRMPLIDSLDVDFNGDNAKLMWPVSIDGKKMQSETYKILGILDQPMNSSQKATR